LSIRSGRIGRISKYAEIHIVREIKTIY